MILKLLRRHIHSLLISFYIYIIFFNHKLLWEALRVNSVFLYWYAIFCILWRLQILNFKGLLQWVKINVLLWENGKEIWVIRRELELDMIIRLMRQLELDLRHFSSALEVIQKYWEVWPASHNCQKVTISRICHIQALEWNRASYLKKLIYSIMITWKS